MPGYDRTEYLDFLFQNKDREMIKVFTGLRGAGKTSLFARYIRLLEEQGVPERRILYMDLSDPDMRRLFPQENLYRRIAAHLAGRERAYLFLDEVQELPDFPRLADALFRIRNFDLYLAGSALRAALPRLTALLPGRCLVKNVYPLSFAETVSAWDRPAEEADLLRYAEESSLPGAHHGEAPRSALDTAVSAALFHEVCRSASIRTGLLEKILTFLSEHLGELLPLAAIESAAGRAGRPLLEKTLRTYLQALEDGGLLLAAPCAALPEDGSPAPAPDGQTCRFFFPDGAMTSLWGRGEDESAPLLNAAAVELFRRYGAVETARTSRGPVDFLTGRTELPALWQLIPRGGSAEAKEKWDILAGAPAAYKKCVLTLTPDAFPAQDGLFVYPLLPWFLRRARTAL